MPTLLQINVDANNGSNGGIARDIGNLVMSQGWKSYIAYGRKQIPSQSSLIRIGSDIDVNIHGLSSRLFDNHGLGSTHATKHFLSKIDIIKPDLIHLHNIHGYFINYKLLFEYLSKKNIPVIWTLHDCWPITGHCSHFVNVNCNRWKTQCFDCPLKSSYPASWFIDKSYQNYNLKKTIFNSLSSLTIVSVSNWLGDIVKESFLSVNPNTVVYNGVDTDIFKPRESNLRSLLGLQEKYVLIGVAVNWTESKGLLDYYKLSQRLPKEYQIILIGLTKSQITKLPNNIIGIEKTENLDLLVEYYIMADIVLNLSYAETFGLSTVEGMACGTPGIVYDRTASPELVSDTTAKIVEAGNIDQIIDAIKTIRAKGGKSYYADECRKHVLKKFDKNDNYKRYIEIYKQTLKKNNDK